MVVDEKENSFQKSVDLSNGSHIHTHSQHNIHLKIAKHTNNSHPPITHYQQPANRDVPFKTNQRHFESSIRHYDKEIFQNIIQRMDEISPIIPVYGFYFLTSFEKKYWKEILEEHIMILDGKRFLFNLFPSNHFSNNNKVDKKKLTSRISTGWSSLFDILDKLEIHFSSTNQNDLIRSVEVQNLTAMINSLYIRSNNEKIIIKNYELKDKNKNNNYNRLLEESKNELNTLNRIHQYCLSHQNSFVFYINNHENNCTHLHHDETLGTELFVHDVINSFIIEYPSICLTALMSGYKTCGVDFNSIDQTHGYVNNIWWANCSHLSTIDKIQVPTTDETVDYYRNMIQTYLIRGFDAHNPNGKNENNEYKSKANQCAYSFDSGLKLVGKSSQHQRKLRALTSKNTMHHNFNNNNICTPQNYRFKLIEIVSKISDDNLLFNNRFNLSNLVTPFNEKSPFLFRLNC
eukprot:gene9756-13125_t